MKEMRMYLVPSQTGRAPCLWVTIPGWIKAFPFLFGLPRNEGVSTLSCQTRRPSKYLPMKVPFIQMRLVLVRERHRLVLEKGGDDLRHEEYS